MNKTFRIILAIELALAISVGLVAQGQGGTPSQLRVRVDANGYLLAAAATQMAPISESTFANTRLNTDADGNLLVAIATSGGGAPSDSKYVLETADADLPNSFSLGSLASGLVLNTVSGSNSTLTKFTGISVTNPTVASGGCTMPSITAGSGSFEFAIVIGSSCTGVKTVTLTMPAAAHTWHITCDNVTHTANIIGEDSSSTTSVVMHNYARTTGLEIDFTAADTLICSGQAG